MTKSVPIDVSDLVTTSQETLQQRRLDRIETIRQLRPFYRDAWTTIWSADCRLVLQTIPPKTVGLLLADPPYGIGEHTDRGDRGRTKGALSYNFAPMKGDHEPFEPQHLLRFPRIILFGANYYADKLPPSSCWLVWDKLNGIGTKKRPIGVCDLADLELAWTNFPGPCRLFVHRWLGLLKDSEQRDKRVHPTQKPVALMSAILDVYTKPGDLIVDPYMGSGPVALAARRMKRKYVGIDIEEEYCRKTLERLKAEFPELRTIRA